MELTEPLIVTVLRHYFPDWEPPADKGYEWAACLCPFHGDSRPSASVSFKHNAFACFACDAKGDAVGIIMREEEIRYPEALRYAESLSPGSVEQLRKPAPRKSGRRVFGESRSDEPPDRSVPPGVRGRTPPWA